MKTTAKTAWLDYSFFVLFGLFVVSAITAAVPYAVHRVSGPDVPLVSTLASVVGLISLCGAVVTGWLGEHRDRPFLLEPLRDSPVAEDRNAPRGGTWVEAGRPKHGVQRHSHLRVVR